MTEQWWHDDMTSLAAQLSQGILNEMKRRITSSKINKEKLKLNESTDRMKSFFEREITRYTNRMEALKQKKIETDNQKEQYEKYKDLLKKIMRNNIELAIKCQKNNIKMEKVTLHDQISCWH